MEKKLRELFDYQRFEPNERLSGLIRETENRYGTELSDEELSLVAAAGEALTEKAGISMTLQQEGVGTDEIGISKDRYNAR